MRRGRSVGAGVTLGGLQHALDGTGWEFGVDLAARDSATIGGMVATNAGGTRVVRHGMMRANVAGLRAVLGTGATVGSLAGLRKDNTGYDLAGLLCGSEGTLGVVTKVRLQLVPTAQARLCALVGCIDMSDAVVLATLLQRTGELEAAEFVTRDGVKLLEQQLGLRSPLHASVVVLVELAGRPPLDNALAACIGGRDNVVATDARSRSMLWQIRDRQTEAINRLGPPHKLDVTVPLAALAQFCDAVRSTVHDGAPGPQVYLFGHLGDGNVHVNITGLPSNDNTLDEAVLRLVIFHHGSISAEHGIGRLKRDWLHLQRSTAELDTFRAIKAACDPSGIMNPGVLVP
jgi:FAD/FMN-containing dehydrogenase